jgi:hypothetical protein
LGFDRLGPRKKADNAAAVSAVFDPKAGMARQSGRERRGDQYEKRQPYQNMIAPARTDASPFQCCRLVIAAEQQSASAGLVVANLPSSV